MAKGILYIMDTGVKGLVKIGKTGVDSFEARMYYLEENGYANVTGLKRAFAIKVDDYDEKEKLIDTIFEKSRVADKELFAIDKNLAIQLFSSLEGEIVYPKNKNKEDIFDNAVLDNKENGTAEYKPQKKNSPINFYECGLSNGDELVCIDDPSIKVQVDGPRKVFYNGKITSLSTLMKERLGKDAIQGTKYFSYKGELLTDLAKRTQWKKEE